VNEAATAPLVVALVVANTVAPKLMATGSEGANRRQVRVIRDPAGPVFGERAHVGLAGAAKVAVVVPVDPEVGRVVEAAVAVVVVTDEGAGDAGAAGWSAVRDAQPVTAKAATETVMAMIRTGRMATSLCRDGPVGLGLQHGLGRSRPRLGRASWPMRTGLGPVAIVDRNEHACAVRSEASNRSPSPQRRRRRGFHLSQFAVTTFGLGLATLPGTGRASHEGVHL
jgi:hypothetical protein